MDEYENPRVQQSAAELFEKLNRFCRGLTLTRNAEDALRMLVSDHIVAARHRGIRWPEMYVMICPSAGAVEVIRRDLDDRSIQTVIRNMAAKYPHIMIEELAFEIRCAFPHYKSAADRAEWSFAQLVERAKARGSASDPAGGAATPGAS